MHVINVYLNLIKMEAVQLIVINIITKYFTNFHI